MKQDEQDDDMTQPDGTPASVLPSRARPAGSRLQEPAPPLVGQRPGSQPSGSHPPGPPGRLAPVLAVSIGGSRIHAGLVSPVRLGAVSTVREVVATTELPTPGAEGPEAILTAVVRAVDELMHERAPAAACGVATAGVVDPRTGVILSTTPTLGDWSGVPMAALLAERLGLPVAMDSDVNAFALGEATAGAAAGASSTLAAAVGTGVGGGMVVGGAIWHGAHAAGGEIGHLPVPGGGTRPCTCGGRGHLESVASGPAMSIRYAEHTGGEHGFHVVAARAEAGEEAARAVLAEGASALGRALAGLVNVFDPDVVVVGGSVAGTGEEYWSPLRAAFEADLLPATRAVSLRPATLGDHAVLIGAAELVLHWGTAGA